jgi:TolA-binding protein
MKRNIMLIVILAMTAAIAHGGQEGKKDTFWDNLRGKLEKVTPAKKTTATTAVGGVRGAKSEEAADIYWKGKETRLEVPEDELQSFNAAVDLASKGEHREALKKFEAFLRLYPQSQLRRDGLQAVDKLKATLAASK